MVGKRIHELRKSKGLSLSELAERAGVAKSYLSNVERGIQSNPSIHFLEKVAKVFDVPIESLLNDEFDLNTEQLDSEWYELILEAMNSGVNKQDFKEFLEFQKWKKSQ